VAEILTAKERRNEEFYFAGTAGKFALQSAHKVEIERIRQPTD
jgi:hypothetical protein